MRYERKDLDAKAKLTAKDRGGKLIRWVLVIGPGSYSFEVVLRLRHWRHCPGCIDDGAPHYGPDGVEVSEETTAMVSI